MQFGQLRRREFITLLGGAAAWPLAAHAQQPVMPMIGFLSSRASSGSATLIAAFHQGLKEAGYVEGQNTMIAFRWAEGHYDRLPALAAELVGMRVTVMVAAGGGPTPRVARAATTTIPIVFMTGDDPVAVGLVESFNRPGGNATGVSQLAIAMEAKRLEILRELIPKISVIAMLINPNNPQSSVQSKEISDAARVIGVQLHILNASTEQDFETVFPMLIRQQTEALIVGADPFFTSRS